MLKEESLLERIAYRLVKKHISGTTMSSALSKAKELNKRNLLASITFLANKPENKAKAKYVTTTYLELIRQVSRHGLRASVHVPLEQLTYDGDTKLEQENELAIRETARKYGVFVWFELNGVLPEQIQSIEQYRGCGVALDETSAVEYLRKYGNSKAIKVIFGEANIKKNAGKKAGDRNIDYICGKAGNTVLSHMPESRLWPMLKNGSKYKKSAIFEFGMGYSRKKINKAVKKGARVSLSVPFGKDWAGYAANNVSEGYMRFIVGNLLKEDNKRGK